MHPFAALVDATEQEWDAISVWAVGALGANLVTVGLLAVWAADPSVRKATACVVVAMRVTSTFLLIFSVQTRPLARLLLQIQALWLVSDDAVT